MAFEFQLTDAAGQRHKYDYTRHTGTEGLPLAMHLGALVVEPIAAAVGPVLLSSMESVAGQGDKQGLLKSLLDNPDALASLDLPAVARAVRTAVAGVPQRTIYDLLKYVNRDGKPLIDGSGRPTMHFDEAYAGNYMEVGRALWEVARGNGFFPELGTLLSAGQKALGAAPGQAASAT